MKLKFLFVLSVLVFALHSCSKDEPKVEENPPTITGHSESGAIGAMLTIDGTNFGATIPENTVTLNGVAVTLNVATVTKLTGTVPSGASTGKISVSTVNGSATSANKFVVAIEETYQPPQIDDQGSTVSELSTSEDLLHDVTAKGSSLVFEITANDNNLFVINELGEIRLAEGNNLDFESKESHKITVAVSDGINTAEAVVTITVNNEIESLFEDPDSFITTWTTAEGNNQITFGVDDELTYNYLINWGDGSGDQLVTASDDQSHIYANSGTYQVAIKGTFPRIILGENYSHSEIMSIDRWGAIQWSSFQNAFHSCHFMKLNATDVPNLENVTSLYFMFYKAWAMDSELIGEWDVKNITDMSYMFSQCDSFNQDLSKWNVSNVTTMQGMFQATKLFNQDLSGWNVQNVKNMQSMFKNTKAFDQNLGNWNIENVESMSAMLDNSSLSTENYSATLVGWKDHNNTPKGITLGASGLEYCDQDAVIARDVLTDANEGFNWTITGDSQCE